MKKLSLLSTLFLAGSLLFHPGKATIKAQESKQEQIKTTQVYKPTLNDYINNLIGLSIYCNNKFLYSGNGILLSPRTILTAHHVIDINCNSQSYIKFIHDNKSRIINTKDLLINKKRKYDLAAILLPSYQKFTNVKPIEIYTGFLPIGLPITFTYDYYKENNSSLLVYDTLLGKTSFKITTCDNEEKNCSDASNQASFNVPLVPGNSGGIVISHNTLIGILTSTSKEKSFSFFSPLQNLKQDSNPDTGYIGSDGFYYPSEKENLPISCNLTYDFIDKPPKEYIYCHDLKNNRLISPDWIAQNRPELIEDYFQIINP